MKSMRLEAVCHAEMQRHTQNCSTSKPCCEKRSGFGCLGSRSSKKSCNFCVSSIVKCLKQSSQVMRCVWGEEPTLKSDTLKSEFSVACSDWNSSFQMQRFACNICSERLMPAGNDWNLLWLDLFPQVISMRSYSASLCHDMSWCVMCPCLIDFSFHLISFISASISP